MAQERIPLASEFSTQREAVRGRVPFLLPCEVESINRRLEELGASQYALRSLLGEAMEQGAETFHDNAPADAINSQGYLISAEAASLIRVQERGTRIDYPRVAESAAIGNLVTIDYGDDTETVLLTGYTRSIAPGTLEALGAEAAISAGSPLGFSLLEGQAGDTTSYEVDNRKLQVGIVAVGVVARASVASPETAVAS